MATFWLLQAGYTTGPWLLVDYHIQFDDMQLSPVFRDRMSAVIMTAENIENESLGHAITIRL